MMVHLFCMIVALVIYNMLMTTSEMGLQSNIERVHTFCKNWGLAINITKSKIMVFSKSGSLTKESFVLIWEVKK